MKELLTALVAAKATFKPIPKDKVNPFHKAKYASLDAVLGAVESSLLMNGLTLSHVVSDGRLITRLYHTSGDFLESSFNLPDLSDPQKLGSIISYYRRYAVCGLLSVTADEDDDGNAAKPQNGAATPSKKLGDTAIVPPFVPPSKPELAIDKANTLLSQVEQYKLDLKKAFEILDWDAARKSGWAKTINPNSFDLWTEPDWQKALHRAYAEIDKLNETAGVA